MPVKRGVVELVGKDGSGKSNLKRSLKREMFNPKHTSTEAIEIEVMHRDRYSNAWMPIERGQIQQHIAEAIEEAASQVVRLSISFNDLRIFLIFGGVYRRRVVLKVYYSKLRATS